MVPESVFVKNRSLAFLGDFSASTRLDDESFIPGLVPVEYSPPEVVLTIPHLARQVPANVARDINMGKHKNCELKIDIWSIGCLAYELLVGYSPFAEGPEALQKEKGVLEKASSPRGRSLARYPPNVPPSRCGRCTTLA